MNDLITTKEAAKLVGCSADCWRDWDRLAKTPAAVRIGKRFVRWRRSELERWLLANCPTRREWDIVEAKRKRNGQAVHVSTSDK